MIKNFQRTAAALIVMSLIVFSSVAPVAAKATPKKIVIPPGATAICKDGTFSFSMHHSGTCSHHKGVAKFYK